MKKYPKLNFNGLKPGSRAMRRKVNRPSTHKKIAQIFKKIGIEHVKEDRAAYVERFFKLWEGRQADLVAIADWMLNEQSVEMEATTWEYLLEPYGLIQLLVFWCLMNRLDLDEVERFLAICDALDRAWQQFFSTILVRHPDLDELVARLETARHQVHDLVVPFFTGEAKPILTPTWARAMMTLTDEFPKLAEGLRR